MTNVAPTDSAGNTPPSDKKIATITAGSSSSLLVLAVELLGVGLFTLLAGASDDVGHIVIIFMIGLWLIFMVTDSAVIAGLGRGLSTVAKGA